MINDQVRKPTTIRQLYDVVTAYVDDNKHSGDVAERWLCSTLDPLLASFSGILNSRPRDADKPAIASFQAAEIEKKISDKKKEVENLERDLKRVRAA